MHLLEICLNSKASLEAKGGKQHFKSILFHPVDMILIITVAQMSLRKDTRVNKKTLQAVSNKV